MKNAYENAEMEIIFFTNAEGIVTDVIVTSKGDIILPELP